MRGVVGCVLAAVGINAIVAAGPAGASIAAANQSYGPAIASVLPTQGEVVGVAHPVVVTFSAPVADRRAAERAIDIKSAPAMKIDLFAEVIIKPRKELSRSIASTCSPSSLMVAASKMLAPDSGRSNVSTQTRSSPISRWIIERMATAGITINL